MPFSPKVEAATERFRRAVQLDRFPHAVIVAGNPRASGLQLAQNLLSLVFPQTAPDLLRSHTDIRWIEPASKSRRITVDVVREIVEFFSLTSYEGGWKAAVFLFADRMNVEAQNVLLKTLEEPPPRSLILLVSDTPAVLLPTIRSRTQFADVLESGDFASSPWYAPLVELLSEPPPKKPCEIFAWADRMNAPLTEFEEQAMADIQEESEELGRADKETREARIASRVREMSDSLLSAIYAWQRDVLAAVVDPAATPAFFPDSAEAISRQARRLTLPQALARLDAVDDFRLRLERNIRSTLAFPLLARSLAL